LNTLPIDNVSESLASMRGIFNSMESPPIVQQTKQQRLCEIIKNYGELKNIEKNFEVASHKDSSIIDMGKSLIASDMKQLMDASNETSTTSKTKKRKGCSSLFASYATLESSDDSINGDDDDSYTSFS
jgi:hypothetical protein